MHLCVLPLPAFPVSARLCEGSCAILINEGEKKRGRQQRSITNTQNKRTDRLWGKRCVGGFSLLSQQQKKKSEERRTLGNTKKSIALLWMSAPAHRDTDTAFTLQTQATIPISPKKKKNSREKHFLIFFILPTHTH
jgi:hypothetical protein